MARLLPMAMRVGTRSHSRSSRRRGEGQGEEERRAAPLAFGFDPYAAAVDLDDAPDQGQPDAGTVTVMVQPLEEAEDPLVVPRIDSDPVVADIEDRLPVALFADSDLDAGQGLVAEEMYRVRDQVLEHLPQPRAVTKDDRQPGKDRHLHLTRGDLTGDQFDRL